MTKEDFQGKVFITAGLNKEDASFVIKTIEKNGGIYKKTSTDFDYLIYDKDSGKNSPRLVWAYGLMLGGKDVSAFTVSEFRMIIGEYPRIIELSGYSADDIPEVQFPQYDPPIYHVSEIDVSGKKAKDWICEYRSKGPWDSHEELWIKYYCGHNKHVIVPSSINGEKVAGICGGAFSRCDAVEIEFPGTIKRLGKVGCGNTSVKSIIIGEGCEAIDWAFFSSAKSLKNIRISRSVSLVDTRDADNPPFYDTPWRRYEMKKERRIIVGSVLTEIMPDNTGVLAIPKGIEAVWLYSLKKYHGEIFFPETVKRILGITGTKNRGIKRGLNNLVIPETLRMVEGGAFDNDEWLKDLSDFTLIINHRLYKLGTPEITDGTLIIPDGIEGIYEGVLDMGGVTSEKESEIKEIKFPKTTTILGPRCLTKLCHLKTLAIPESITEIGKYAFGGCVNLEEVVLPDSMSFIGDGAFKYCNSLKKVVLPSYVKNLGKDIVQRFMERSDYFDSLYRNVEPLKYVGINVPTVVIHGIKYYREPSDELLSKYKNLLTAENTIYEAPTFPADMIPVNKAAFDKLVTSKDVRTACMTIRITPEASYDAFICSGARQFSKEVILKKYAGSAESYKVPENVTMIADAAFKDNKSLRHIDLNNVTEIGEAAFEKCWNLETMESMNHLRKVGERAFSASALSRADLPLLVEIPKELFKNCRSIRYADIRKARLIGEKAFDDCTSLTEVRFDSAERISHLAFNDCNSLQIPKLPETLSDIGRFALPKLMDDIVIPKSVQKVGLEFFNMYNGTARIKIYRSSLYAFRDFFDPPRRLRERGEKGFDEYYDYYWDDSQCYEMFLELTVLDDSSDEVVGFIPLYWRKRGALYPALDKGFRPDNTFDYAFIDEELSSYVHYRGSDEYAALFTLLRLEKPFGLSESSRKKYMEYLTDDNMNNARMITFHAIKTKDLNMLARLNKLEVIDKYYLDEFIEYSIKYSATDITAFLLNIKALSGWRYDPLDEDL